MSRYGEASSYIVTYRLECGYTNRLQCKWQCHVKILFDQDNAVDQYLPKHPDDNTDPRLDRTLYERQTMFAVKTDMRLIVHANHVCIISTVGVHSNHNG